VNEREKEIRETEERQNKMIHDRVADRLRLLTTLKSGYEQKKSEEKKTKRVSIDQVPEHLRDNPYHLLSYGFTAFNDDDNGNPDA
jgi:hypothetical protein